MGETGADSALWEYDRGRHHVLFLYIINWAGMKNKIVLGVMYTAITIGLNLIHFLSNTLLKLK